MEEKTGRRDGLCAKRTGLYISISSNMSRCIIDGWLHTNMQPYREYTVSTRTAPFYSCTLVHASYSLGITWRNASTVHDTTTKTMMSSLIVIIDSILLPMYYLSTMLRTVWELKPEGTPSQLQRLVVSLTVIYYKRL